jgi:hypothetical protein
MASNLPTHYLRVHIGKILVRVDSSHRELFASTIHEIHKNKFRNRKQFLQTGNTDYLQSNKLETQIGFRQTSDKAIIGEIVNEKNQCSLRKISVVPVKQKDQCSCLVGDLEKHSRNSKVCDLVVSGEWRVARASGEWRVARASGIAGLVASGESGITGVLESGLDLEQSRVQRGKNSKLRGERESGGFVK